MDALQAATLTHLMERIEALERRHKVIEAEWDDMFDRFRRLLARISKRARDSAALEQEGPVEPSGANGPGGTRNPLAAAILSGHHRIGG